MTPLQHEPDPEFRALIDEGRTLADAGDLEGAERLFKGALSVARDVHPQNEAYALASLMTVYHRTGRHFESLVLARVVTDRLLQEGAQAKAVGCLAVYVNTLHEFGADAEVRRAMRELGPLLADVPVEANTMAHENYHALCTVQALEEQRQDVAESHLRIFTAIEPEGEALNWRKAHDIAQLRAQVASRRGDHSAALAHLDEGLELAQASPDLMLGVHRARATCLTELGREDEALAVVLDLLERVRALEDDPFRASTRIQLATWIAGWLEANGNDPESVRRAYDLAVAAVLARICQLDAAMQELPELGLDESTSGAVLAAVRKTFLQEQGQLLERVAAFLTPTANGDAPATLAREVLYRTTVDAYIRVCAWCERVSQSHQPWLPIGHFISRKAEGIRITHAICPACADQLG